MKLEVVRTIAKSHGIHTGKRSKIDLIKFIQSDEGNFDCFATACAGCAIRVRACGAMTVLKPPARENNHDE